MEKGNQTGISWGVKITILYCSFAALIIFMVVLSFSRKVDLVAPDYYQQEINYNSRMKALNNAAEFSEELNIISNGKNVTVNYPKFFSEKNLNGKIHFFRPSDSSHDKTYEVKNNSGNQEIKFNEIKGYYKVKIDINCENKNYYFEKELFLN